MSKVKVELRSDGWFDSRERHEVGFGSNHYDKQSIRRDLEELNRKGLDEKAFAQALGSIRVGSRTFRGEPYIEEGMVKIDTWTYPLKNVLGKLVRE